MRFIKKLNRMKKLILLLPVLLMVVNAWACPACEKQQPKVLRGIAHGTGPQSNWDYVIVIFTAILVVLTLFFSVKWLIKPGEKQANHIKRNILNFES